MDAEILILEADEQLAASIRLHLEREGFRCRSVSKASTAIREIRVRPPGLLVFGQADQDFSWTSTLSQIRALPLRSWMPILMLADTCSEPEWLAAFQCGVDDVIGKPFSMKLLAARVTALLRRAHRPTASRSVLSTGSVTLDLERFELWVEGRPVNVSAKEFRVLEALLKADGRVLSRNELIQEALGGRTTVSDRCVDAYIIRLRRKLKVSAGLLKTVRGCGYALRSQDSPVP
jgi:DNA-binding response OmpR family regulator